MRKLKRLFAGALVLPLAIPTFSVMTQAFNYSEVFNHPNQAKVAISEVLKNLTNLKQLFGTSPQTVHLNIAYEALRHFEIGAGLISAPEALSKLLFTLYQIERLYNYYFPSNSQLTQKERWDIMNQPFVPLTTVRRIGDPRISAVSSASRYLKQLGLPLFKEYESEAALKRLPNIKFQDKVLIVYRYANDKVLAKSAEICKEFVKKYPELLERWRATKEKAIIEKPLTRITNCQVI